MREKNYHLLGIGGAGMSALASFLLERGNFVSGFDQTNNRETLSLSSKGAVIAIGSSAPIPEKSQVVVYSSAIPPDHPSFKEAIRRALPLLHRSECLALLSQKKRTLLIAGTHGKTSTSALLAHTLSYSGADPSFVIGGTVPSLEVSGRSGCGSDFVIEADESDGSFLSYQGTGGILTNIEIDHLDFWKTEEALHRGFQTFIENMEDPTLFFWCLDDPVLARLSPKGVSYGFHREASFRLTEVISNEGGLIFTALKKGGKTYSDLTLPILGRHQALNALAVFGLALTLGIEEDKIRAAFQTFSGVKRRLEKKGVVRGITFYDDYAHHPTEIRAVLSTLRDNYCARRLIAIFEPHRFSRTRELEESFISSLEEADVSIITDIFPAGEKPIMGVTAEAMQKKHRGECYYFPSKQLPTSLPPLLKEGDIVVTLGAGPITKVCDLLISKSA